MPRTTPTLVAVLAALALGSAAGSAQTVRGRIMDLDRGRPLADAHVAVQDSTGVRIAETRTNADGRFALALPRAGTVQVMAWAPAYRTAITPPLAVGVEEVKELQVGLPFSAIPLPEVTVSVPEPARRDRPAGRGERLTSEDLDRMGRQRDFLSLLRYLGVPSLRIWERYEPGSSVYVPCIEFTQAQSPGNRVCRMVMIVLDGQVIADAGSFLQWFDASQVADVEFFRPVEAGARWGTGSQNGVLVITQHRRE